MNPDELLRLENVVAGYGRPVTDPVSFSVTEGQIIGLGGTNGAGKSTILRAITGIAKVFSGRIRKAPRAFITHHWQRPEKPPEVALLGRELFSMLGADVTVAPEIIRDILDIPVNRLSGGQFQFLQTAACLAGPANLVFLDEPTNNLDGGAIETLSVMLQKQLHPDRAVILVSHEKEFLKMHCESIVELS